MKRSIEKPLTLSGPANDAESVPALKSKLGRVPLAEMMLDAHKVEATLKAIVRRKRPGDRRLAEAHFERGMSLNGRQMA